MRIEVEEDVATRTVFSGDRIISQPPFRARRGLRVNVRSQMNGLDLLELLEDDAFPLVFFDPQYRTILDRQQYGNEGKRQKRRAELPQMDEDMIRSFIAEIERVLMPSGHLMLWVDKFILCSGLPSLLKGSELELVDMITWSKDRMGMGYRTRRFGEHLVVLQKAPKRAKGIWTLHNIPDVWVERIQDKAHTHAKPIALQQRLIEAVTNPGDIVIDPAAGSFSVMTSALAVGRDFLGCDILG